MRRFHVQSAYTCKDTTSNEALVLREGDTVVIEGVDDASDAKTADSNRQATVRLLSRGDLKKDMNIDRGSVPLSLLLPIEDEFSSSLNFTRWPRHSDPLPSLSPTRIRGSSRLMLPASDLPNAPKLSIEEILERNSRSVETIEEKLARVNPLFALFFNDKLQQKSNADSKSGLAKSDPNVHAANKLKLYKQQLYAMVNGDANATVELATRLITGLKNANELDLVAFLPILATFLSTIPSWLNWQRDAIIAILNLRAMHIPEIQQVLSVTWLTGLFSDRQTDMEELLFDKVPLNKDCVNFFEILSKVKDIKEGDQFTVPKNMYVYHPFESHQGRIERVNVLKVFNSNAKPLLLGLVCASSTVVEDNHLDDNGSSNKGHHRRDISDKAISTNMKRSDKLKQMLIGRQQNGLIRHRGDDVIKGDILAQTKVVFKCGDDLRQDHAVLAIFQFMNHLWQQEKLYHKGRAVFARSYGTIPMGDLFGCIEFVPDCIPIKDVKKLTLDQEALDKLIVSAAGSYIAGYCIGARDRHWDNILIHKTDGWLFHIDFGHILGHTVTLDTAPFAVTQDLADTLGPDNWRTFISLCMKAFALIRKHREALILFIENVCSCIPEVREKKQTLRSFLMSVLMMELDIGQACLSIKRQLNDAPKNAKTRLKNAVHGFKTDTVNEMFK